MAATDGIALNFAFTGKGNDSGPAGLVDQIRAGAAGLKVHEVCGSRVMLDCYAARTRPRSRTSAVSAGLGLDGFGDRLLPVRR